jgi:chemotaxis signal transduction protein
LSHDPAALVQTLLELRRSFDAGFARPPEAADTGWEAVLAVQAGAAPLAVRTAEIAGLFEGAPLTPLPSRRPEFLGIASLRGQLVPVYDLARLLALEPGAAPRWRLLLRVPEPLALAFDSFDGQFRVPAADLPAEPTTSGEGGRPVVRAGGVQREVLAMGPVLEQIRRLLRELGKET